MNPTPGHLELLREIKKNKGRKNSQSGNDSYINSGHFYYEVAVPIRRQIAKAWLKKNKDMPEAQFVAVLNALYKGRSHEEKSMASMLIGYSRSHRERVSPAQVGKWLDHLAGWAEVDSLCQNVFTAQELLGNWQQWSAAIEKLSKDKNINKRRASLVLLTGPVTYSKDKKLSALALKMIGRLKREKPILITKAVSWLLRSMVQHHKKDVVAYVRKNMSSLPKIAIRETMRKVRTGKK